MKGKVTKVQTIKGQVVTTIKSPIELKMDAMALEGEDVFIKNFKDSTFRGINKLAAIPRAISRIQEGLDLISGAVEPDVSIGQVVTYAHHHVAKVDNPEPNSTQSAEAKPEAVESISEGQELIGDQIVEKDTPSEETLNKIIDIVKET